MNIISVLSRSPWRLTVAVDGTPSVSAGDYAITRKDGLIIPTVARRLWLVGVNTVEIALSEALLSDVDYVLTLPNEPGPPSRDVVYRQPLNPQGTVEPEPEDIAAEAYGVDTDWINGARSPSGDLIDVRGAECLKSDMVALALIAPREIFHRPLVGAGLTLDVNSAGTNANLAEQRARLVAQWKADDRVAAASATSTIDTEGRVRIDGNITDAIAQQTQPVTVRGT